MIRLKDQLHEKLECDLPGKGRWHHCNDRKFQEVIVFVHHYGGKQRSLARHVGLIKQLGYNCVTFDLSQDFFSKPTVPVSRMIKFGQRHVWADEIENILNIVPGNKIVFSFSSPSASAIEAIARRRAVDIKGLICDGGPFLGRWTAYWRYFSSVKKIKSIPMKLLLSGIGMPIWSLNPNKEFYSDLKKFPDQFPILSIRGWKDHLVRPGEIDEVFEPHQHINWKKLNLPEAGHLKGLKYFPNEYVPQLKSFLLEISECYHVNSNEKNIQLN